MLLLCFLSLTHSLLPQKQVVYLDQVVDKLLAGHRNNKQHKAQLKQHKAGDMAPYKQVAL